jgi:hypothetical protein
MRKDERHARQKYPREWPSIHCRGSWVGPGPVGKGAKNLVPTRMRTPDRPVRSESLYRLSYSSRQEITRTEQRRVFMTQPRASVGMPDFNSPLSVVIEPYANNTGVIIRTYEAQTRGKRVFKLQQHTCWNSHGMTAFPGKKFYFYTSSYIQFGGSSYDTTHIYVTPLLQKPIDVIRGVSSLPGRSGDLQLFQNDYYLCLYIRNS